MLQHVINSKPLDHDYSTEQSKTTWQPMHAYMHAYLTETRHYCLECKWPYTCQHNHARAKTHTRHILFWSALMGAQYLPTYATNFEAHTRSDLCNKLWSTHSNILTESSKQDRQIVQAPSPSISSCKPWDIRCICRCGSAVPRCWRASWHAWDSETARACTASLPVMVRACMYMHS